MPYSRAVENDPKKHRFFTESERFPSLAVALCEMRPLGVRSIFFFDPLPSVQNSLPILYAFFTKKCVLLRKMISLKPNLGVSPGRVKPVLAKWPFECRCFFYRLGDDANAFSDPVRFCIKKERAPNGTRPS